MTDLSINTTRTPDSIKYNKDCNDFECLEDGTITKEYRYCDRSRQCRQIDVVGGLEFPMEAHYLEVADIKTGKVVEWDYFCTGMHDLRPLKERMEDDKAS